MEQEIIKKDDGSIVLRTITEEVVDISQIENLITSLRAGILDEEIRVSEINKSIAGLPDFLVNIIQKELDFINEDILRKKEEIIVLESRLNKYGESI